MKKTVITVLGVLMIAGTLMAAPGRDGSRDHAGMLFRLVSSVRAELGLNETQNQKLDQLLNEVRTYWQSQMKGIKGQRDKMMDEFVSDNFNAEAIRVERQKLRDQKRAEIEKFLAEKIQVLHDLLTKEQRQKLVTIMKQKRQNFMNNMRKGRRGGRMGGGMQQGAFPGMGM
ncbi:MAG: periplasmic heavy metal sensor [Acidobacteria bacterium]|nr:periplasmic heavy metal sensor [Acidobacteriota bacterium]